MQCNALETAQDALGERERHLRQVVADFERYRRKADAVQRLHNQGNSNSRSSSSSSDPQSINSSKEPQTEEDSLRPQRENLAKLQGGSLKLRKQLEELSAEVLQAQQAYASALQAADFHSIRAELHGFADVFLERHTQLAERRRRKKALEMEVAREQGIAGGGSGKWWEFFR